jgi:hypothetical protein
MYHSDLPMDCCFYELQKYQLSWFDRKHSSSSSSHSNVTSSHDIDEKLLTWLQTTIIHSHVWLHNFMGGGGGLWCLTPLSTIF